MDNEKSKFSFWGTVIKLMLIVWPWIIVAMQTVQVFTSESIYELTANEWAKCHIAAIIGSFAGAVAMSFILKKRENRNK